MKKARLFLNGEKPNVKILQSLRADKEVTFNVACDGALDYISSYLSLDLVLGDFDSVTPQRLKGIDANKIIKFNPCKNYTDGYLGMKEILARGYTEIEIFGALGGRVDHEQYNLVLLSLALSKKANAIIIGDELDIFLKNDNFTFSTQSGKIISLVPFTDKAHIISTRGLQYPLTEYTMNKVENLEADDFIMGVSNIATGDEVEVKVGSGYVLVYMEK